MLSKELPRKKLLIFGSVILVLLLLLLVSLYKQKKSLEQKIMVDNQVGTTDLNQIPAPDFQTVSSPAMTFKTYDTNNASVALPPSVKIHVFKSDYSQPNVEALAQKLGLTDTKTEGSQTIYYNLNDETNRGYLKFNAQTGNYQYISYGGYKIPVSSGAVSQNAKAFLLDSGLIDATVDCNITYQRTDVPNTTFVECHRDWVKTGLPILNFAGLLNVPDVKSIKDLKIGMVTDEGETDPAVVNVSTGQNGMERPNDFNTLTIAVDNQGFLAGITSNLKLIDASTDYAQSSLLTPEEAVGKFRANDTQLSLIVPTENNMSWTSVFPENTAYDLTANINDIMLVYIESPFGGKSLTPMYLVRGEGETVEGYSVKFLQAIPAIKGQEQAYFEGEYYGEDVAGLMAQGQPADDPTLKLKTFVPEQRVVQQGSGTCVPAEEQLSPIISLGTLGNLGQWTINAPSPQDVGDSGPFRWFRSGQWYLIPANAQVLPLIDEVTASFDALNLQGRGSNLREMGNLQNEWNKYNMCPLRVSGGSPTLFGYGKADQIYEIKVGRSLVYLKTNSDNTIYYEYKPVSFERPEKGWNVAKDGLNQFANQVGKEMELTSQETDKLAFELNLAASKLKYEKLFVGLIPQAEVNKKVPLTVSPGVPLNRYHFYITSAGVNVSSPTLPKVVRTSEMILEVGAVAQ